MSAAQDRPRVPRDATTGVVLLVYGGLAAFSLVRPQPWVPFAVACPEVPGGVVPLLAFVVGPAAGLFWRWNPRLLLLVPVPAAFALPPLSAAGFPVLDAVFYLGGTAVLAAVVETSRQLFAGPDRDWEALATALGVLVLAVVLTLAVTSVAGLGRQVPDPEPSVDFESEYDPGSDTLRLRHASGDAVGEGVLVRVNGERRSVRLTATRTVTNGAWTAVPALGLDRGAASGPLEAGDTVRVVGVERGDTVTVFWRRSPERCARTTLGRFVVGDGG